MQTNQYRREVERGGLEREELQNRLDDALGIAARQQQTIDELRQTVQQQQRTIDEYLQTIQQQQQTIDELRRRVEQLEQELGRRPTTRLDEGYSVDSEEHREARKTGKRRTQKSDRRGRHSTEDKLARATQEQNVYPDGLDPEACTHHRSRAIWRIVDQKAVLVAYHVYRGPGGVIGRIPGALPNCEYGLEILVTLASLQQLLSVSMDKVCALMWWQHGLLLRKSQMLVLLNRLSREWEPEFDALCTLLAHSLVVHTDETSWSIKSVWAFLSDQVRVILFGVNKDGATLEQLLNKGTFQGTLITDDAAVYRDFTQAQKCWAHLLRKAIRLTLLAPDDSRYRGFLDGLLGVYRDGLRIQRDQRYKQETRKSKTLALEDRLEELCRERYRDERQPGNDTEADYLRLVNELMRLMEADELFLYVYMPGVSGTNNASERQLRGPALDRSACRASKTSKGARRRTITSSVLESLSMHLETATLQTVVDEALNWLATGVGRFRRMVESLQLPPPPGDLLTSLFPPASS